MKFVPHVLLFFAATASAVADETSDNLEHHRHHHPHNPAHPTQPLTEDRFTTSREDGELPALTDEAPSFTFAVFGDRTGGPDDGVNILADAVRDTNLLEPDLVMTVGDLIQGYNERGEWLVQMREYKDIMDRLICPWFPVAGNHDIYFRGDDAPAQEHEDAYEMHFGPLWYAFEHKNSWFVVLYSDEGDPQTGERTFRKPASQRMSPEQFAWLKKTLKRTADADHVFVFVHHPRWIGGNYGDDWDKVHAELVEAGNVSAVFAGHVHYMRYDPKDGIHYVTLATTGGHQSGNVPSAGQLHHYNLVTVRESQLGITAYPVGEAIDVRDITPELLAEVRKLSGMRPELTEPLTLAEDGAVDTVASLRVENPAPREIDLAVTPNSEDARWRFLPDHRHLKLAPGESRELEFRVVRPASSLDADFAAPRIDLATEYLTDTSRYPLPAIRSALSFQVAGEPDAGDERALDFDGEDDHLRVEPYGPAASDALTLECWFNGRDFAGRTGLINKTESSEYGFFVNDGRPQFLVFVGDSYLKAAADGPSLDADRWYHIAGVYDGTEARLYLDGELIARAERAGRRRLNHLPLVIGGDVTGSGEATSHFDGLIDAVRLSATARYSGDSFEPERRPAADGDTRLLLNMDRLLGNLLYDESETRRHATIHGEPAVTPVR